MNVYIFFKKRMHGEKDTHVYLPLLGDASCSRSAVHPPIAPLLWPLSSHLLSTETTGFLLPNPVQTGQILPTMYPFPIHPSITPSRSSEDSGGRSPGLNGILSLTCLCVDSWTPHQYVCAPPTPPKQLLLGSLGHCGEGLGKEVSQALEVGFGHLCKNSGVPVKWSRRGSLGSGGGHSLLSPESPHFWGDM